MIAIMISSAITNGAEPSSTSESSPRPRMPWMTSRLMPKGGEIIAVWMRMPYHTEL